MNNTNTNLCPSPEEDSIKHAKRIEKKLDEHFAGKRELDLHDVEQMAEDAWARSNAANDLATMRAWEVVEDKCCDVFREIGISNAEFAMDQASSYESPDRAIHAHEQNVFDTTSGCRVAQDIAFEAFHKVINQMNVEGGA